MDTANATGATIMRNRRLRSRIFSGHADDVFSDDDWPVVTRLVTLFRRYRSTITFGTAAAAVARPPYRLFSLSALAIILISWSMLMSFTRELHFAAATATTTSNATTHSVHAISMVRHPATTASTAHPSATATPGTHLPRPPVYVPTDGGPTNQSAFCQRDFGILGRQGCDRFGFAPSVEHAASTVAAGTATAHPSSAEPPCTLESDPPDNTFPSSAPELAHLPYDPLPQPATQMVEAITNTFENGTPNYAYASCEHLADGRGFTCGRIGFTTGTGDALWVVERYVKRRGQDALIAYYLPELRRLARLPSCDTTGRDNIHGLDGFDRIWSYTARTDPHFQQVQDELTEQEYLVPALKIARMHNVTSVLGRAIFYDTVVQHGLSMQQQPQQPQQPITNSEHGIDMQRLLTLTGPRRSDESEVGWLARMLMTRGQMLCCFPDGVWPASADRIHDLRMLLESGNSELNGVVRLHSSGIDLKLEAVPVSSLAALPELRPMVVSKLAVPPSRSGTGHGRSKRKTASKRQLARLIAVDRRTGRRQLIKWVPLDTSATRKV